MRPRTLVAAALALPLALSSLAAHVPTGCYVANARDAETPDDDLIVCEQLNYLHGSDTKVSNLSDVDAQPVVGWDQEAPTGSVTEGAGAGAAGIGATRPAGNDTFATLDVAGTFTGPIDVIDLDLHAIAPTGVVYTLDDLSMQVVVDGVTIVNPSTQIQAVANRPAPNSALPAGTIQFDLALTNIAAYMELAQLDLSPDAEHTVEISVRGWFIDTTNWVWVFDTVEVPSAINFNPVTLDPNASVHPVL